MKILHTADLHLKHRHKYTELCDNGIWDKLFELKMSILDQIHSTGMIRKYGVDAVVVAGDVFDGTNPIEPIKAEFVKWLNCFELGVPVFIIPGNHDKVSDDNYALMDIREMSNGRVSIFNSDFHIGKDVGIFHLMMEGVDEHYRDSIKYSDERFAPYSTILLGDYHSFFYRKYAGKLFTYSGAPYPTRFGEENHSISIIDTESKSIKLVKLKAYRMDEYSFEDIDVIEIPSQRTSDAIVKCIVKCKYEDRPQAISVLSELREKQLEGGAIDFVYSIKSADTSSLEGTGGKSIEDVSYSFIEKNCFNPTEAVKRFKSVMAQE